MLIKWISNPYEYRYNLLAIVLFLTIALVLYCLFTWFNNKKRMRKSLAQQKNEPQQQSSIPNTKKSNSIPSNKIYVAQADKGLDPIMRNEFEEFGTLITVINSKKAKHFISGIIILGFNTFMAYTFGKESQNLMGVDNSSPFLIVLIVMVISLFFIYLGLLSMYNGTYSIRLYKKGLIVRSLLKTNAYYYNNIKEIKTYSYQSKGITISGRSFLSGKPVWIWELHFNDGIILRLKESIYQPEMYDKLTRWEKSLTYS